MNARRFVSAFSCIAAHTAYGLVFLAPRTPTTFLLKSRPSRTMDPRTEIFQPRTLTTVSGDWQNCISSIRTNINNFEYVFLLSVALSYESSFESFNSSISPSFPLVDPFATNGFKPFRQKLQESR